ncbi:MAG: efflux transporter periplasmic adaptor subunit [Candidatus Accumulibacter sp. 66-26]|nr:MAG: efflux transporter periplasmic adaptor subunit [Candidatus Accumulibacter sp. 66-26]
MRRLFLLPRREAFALLVSLPLMAGSASGQAQPAAAPASAASAVSGGGDGRSALERQEIRAQLSPRRYTTLGAELGAKISRIGVKEGERFKAGQVLVSFDCSLQAAQLQRAKATLSAADRTHGANSRLAELNSVGRVELDTSAAEVAKARADVNLMNATLAKCNLTAPFAGRVAEQKVREQQFVQPGQALLDILDDSALELEFIIPSKWLAWLKAGTGFKVRIDETAREYPARITRIGARVDPVSQSVKVAAVIDGSFPELIAGMSGKVLPTVPGSAP